MEMKIAHALERGEKMEVETQELLTSAKRRIEELQFELENSKSIDEKGGVEKLKERNEKLKRNIEDYKTKVTKNKVPYNFHQLHVCKPKTMENCE